MEPLGQHPVGRRLHQPHRYSIDKGLRDFNHGTLPPGQKRKNLERRFAGDTAHQMTTIYSARWVLPMSAAAIENGAAAVEGERIAGVGPHAQIVEQFPESQVEVLGDAAILPGLIN